MKIRSGFVSNSSSSSFIVGFKKRPQSVEEVHELLFGKEPGNIGVYDYSLPTRTIAEEVFQDIQRQQPATVDQITSTAGSGWFPGHPEYHFNGNSKVRQLQKEFGVKFPKMDYYDTKTIKGKEAKTLAKRITVAQRAEWDEESRRRDEALSKYVKTILPKFAGLEVYLFEYGDHDGQTVLEHGDIFQRLSHEVINKH